MVEPLSDREKQLLKDLIDRGEPLPPKYKLSIFADASTTELVWPGKTQDVETVVLPFQSVEQVDEPRAEMKAPLSLFEVAPSGRQSGGWANKLIWGDNRLVLSSLVGGPVRQQIEAAGGLKLVYIDPPFDVGADFSVEVQIGEEQVTKAPSVVEELAYRDTWGSGRDSYLAMMRERLALIHSLMADDGFIFVHCDWRVDAHLRLVLDELFGSSNHRNSIVWVYAGKGLTNVTRTLVRNYATIFMYSKSNDATPVDIRTGEVTESVLQRWGRYMDPDMKIRFKALRVSGDALELAKARDAFRKNFGREPKDSDIARDYSEGALLRDVWTDIPIVRENDAYVEFLGYPTQKPERLLERVVRIGSREGDLVADFFCGSGTTMAVAERLGRKWIGCDLGRFAVHTSRKRLISVQRRLAAESKPFRSFEVLNLGKYERQYFAGVDPSLPEKMRAAESAAREAAYLDLVCRAYSAEPLTQSPPFHARRGKALVMVGPIDAPVARAEVLAAVDSALELGSTQVDVLGFEFEMGLSPAVKDEAAERGVQLALKYIPNDVFDKRAVIKGDVRFYDVAYIEVRAKVVKGTVTIALTDFGVFYRQEDLAEATASLKKGQSRVVIDGGMIVKVTQPASGKPKTEVLTKTWSDWIDYWAVDFDFESRKETLRVVADGQEKSVWSGRYVFENEWQSFRTRQDRNLELTSAPHTYSKPGKYRVAVKVIDIFGNDTTKVLDVEVK